MELSLLKLPTTKENQLYKKGLETIEDILEFLPKDYYDFSHPYKIETAVSNCLNENLAIIGTLLRVKKTAQTVVATITDNESLLDIVFINQFYKITELS